MYVTTIIPAYNSAATLAQAIESAFAQEIEDHEVIVVDDGSTDDTAAILAGYGDRIRTISQANRGSNRSRNSAIPMAHGEYIAFLDADDIWLPGHLARSCALLDKNPASVLAFTNVIPMNDRGELGSPWIVGSAPALKDLLTHGWRIYPSAVTIRRSVLETCGGFDERLTKLADSYLWMRARELGTFEYLAEPLVIYRIVDFYQIGDRYAGGFELFAKAVHERYGRAALPLTRELRGVFASSTIAKALMQTENGEMLTACATIARVAWRSPRDLFKYGLIPLLFGPANLRRVLRPAGPPRGIGE